ncbi:sensor histidine kinase [Nonomuraea jiangxiensis]|uniref:histidine kinase n=1 Tax=Nonomuraea jiangxiensis TaxID=633440 RepID=A0A1G8RHE3_9ACTN|nr:ATP-binding protein [Nonomuraea jiangxiensis]SDJ16351.1 two-component system, NarL family, sensor histidine kinase DesK [Nonomuraea jiangxiensis]
MRGGQSLAEALEGCLAEWSEQTGIAVETWALPATDVPSPVSSGVMTTMREALSNVEKHSRARTVSVAVTVGRSGLRMTISDNGQGFTLTRAGRGIARMRAAFAEIGGSLSVSSVLGEGTTVTGTVPTRR